MTPPPIDALHQAQARFSPCLGPLLGLLTIPVVAEKWRQLLTIPPVPPGIKVLQVRNPFGALEVFWSSDFDFCYLPSWPLFSPGQIPPTPHSPKRIPDPALLLPPLPEHLSSCKCVEYIHATQVSGSAHSFPENDFHGLLRASPLPASLLLLRGLLDPS